MTRETLLRLVIAALGINVVAVSLPRRGTTPERTTAPRPPPIVRGCSEPGSEQLQAKR